MYYDGPLLLACLRQGRLSFGSATSFSAIRTYTSAVELRCRLRINSRTADMAYRTARPILMKRGPVPLSRDLA
jgi:hypothetical protein